MPPADAIDDPRRTLTRAGAVLAELRGVVADLSKQVEARQAHIHRPVKMTFGRGGERVEGPTPFDGIEPPEAEVPTPVGPPTPEVPHATKRKGHGRRREPADLPRRPEVIDPSDAEKVCGCCGTTEIRIGQIVRERLDDQPMALFIRELVRPVRRGRPDRPAPRCTDPGSNPGPTRRVRPDTPLTSEPIGLSPSIALSDLLANDDRPTGP